MASPGKRSRDSSMEDQSSFRNNIERSRRRSRTLNTFQDSAAANDSHTIYRTPYANTTDASDTRHTAEEGSNKLANKQKKFLRLWYEDFAQLSVGSPPPSECVSALAKVIRTQPHLVFEYIDQRHKSVHDTGRSLLTEELSQASPHSPHDPYLLAEANDHLEPITLTLVEKYVTACRRRRSQNDGRRSVNTGPYRCTFGCGYRTKRAFDWRRHEETHDPQELWLCTICSQKDSQNPFLVNRKDKFLKHVNDKHGGYAAEKVLDSSKVAFVPRAELACPLCGTDSGSWDERCRHVLGHFEDEVERGMKRVRVVREEPEDDDEPALGDSADSVKSGGNGAGDRE
ncbi:hypothetical protein CC86DRAFT_312263 [Ophiobolus disseminans]|uniref:C2H2-type domain-containing protein n=1 Tax=Ophiobolus disseminans TaxID=1469910 RepID=A0A6A7ANL0_9PLEO|nr:hypothetical protein CC86DRAFT_312263 [Ophiobolus disseminans]